MPRKPPNPTHVRVNENSTLQYCISTIYFQFHLIKRSRCQAFLEQRSRKISGLSESISSMPMYRYSAGYWVFFRSRRNAVTERPMLYRPKNFNMVVQTTANTYYVIIFGLTAVFIASCCIQSCNHTGQCRMTRNENLASHPTIICGGGRTCSILASSSCSTTRALHMNDSGRSTPLATNC